MPLTADVLLRAARRAGVPAIAAKVGEDYSLELAPEASDADRAARAAFLKTFDPDAPEVLQAEVAYAAAQQLTLPVRAFWLAWFRMANRRDPTDDEKAAWTAALTQAFRDISGAE